MCASVERRACSFTLAVSFSSCESGTEARTCICSALSSWRSCTSRPCRPCCASNSCASRWSHLVRVRVRARVRVRVRVRVSY